MENIAAIKKPSFCCLSCGGREYGDLHEEGNPFFSPAKGKTEMTGFQYCKGCGVVFVLGPEKFSQPDLSVQMQKTLNDLREVAPLLADKALKKGVPDDDDSEREKRRTVPRLGYT